MRKLYLAMAVVVMMCAMGSAQDRAKRMTGNDEMQVKQRMTDEWAAWTAMQYDKLDAFYAKDANLVFFDIAPMKYDGWPAYKKGAAQMLSVYKSLSGKLSDDVSIHINGNTAWVTATYHGVGKKKDGSKDDVMDIRVTSVWEKRGGQWMIVHEHASVPMG